MAHSSTCHRKIETKFTRKLPLDFRNLQKLEDTGLSRNEILFEILFEQQKGLSLKDDPFFQFVKNSKTAREMLLKPGEELTADRVVELALR